ncbi:hypothetical protein CORC01_10808 [Colletotrichum orchidophilum]|uniref:Uncharacterized protein n=1 Tax=Colletotrichum orchidophilum TaxID=1209926 RepID=A0A1G4AXM2_9PEZI|nr:uncharacterized protein CORC01_10808 [Colletotrichum orchidophilum]OHE93909.1 hypothetical protein CORC01_10808 [Colletotrichum orchidophilum]
MRTSIEYTDEWKPFLLKCFSGVHDIWGSFYQPSSSPEHERYICIGYLVFGWEKGHFSRAMRTQMEQQEQSGASIQAMETLLNVASVFDGAEQPEQNLIPMQIACDYDAT